MLSFQNMFDRANEQHINVCGYQTQIARAETTNQLIKHQKNNFDNQVMY